MKNLLFASLISLILAFVLLSSNSLLANPNERDHGGYAQLVDLYVFGELGGEMLGLINTTTDQLIQIDLLSLPGWPQQSPTQDAAMQHVWVTPNGKTLYFTLDAIYPNPSAVVILEVKDIDWDARTADLVVQKVFGPGPTRLELTVSIRETNGPQPAHRELDAARLHTGPWSSVPAPFPLYVFHSLDR